MKKILILLSFVVVIFGCTNFSENTDGLEYGEWEKEITETFGENIISTDLYYKPQFLVDRIYVAWPKNMDKLEYYSTLESSVKNNKNRLSEYFGEIKEIVQVIKVDRLKTGFIYSIVITKNIDNKEKITGLVYKMDEKNKYSEIVGIFDFLDFGESNIYVFSNTRALTIKDSSPQASKDYRGEFDITVLTSSEIYLDKNKKVKGVTPIVKEINIDNKKYDLLTYKYKKQ